MLSAKERSQKATPTQKALVIQDAFKGQMTNMVKSKLTSLSINVECCSSHHDRFLPAIGFDYQWSSKETCQEELIQYYSTVVQQQLQSGKSAEEIEVDL